MASPICEVREGAGAWTSTVDGFTATAASSLSIRLANTGGVSTWSLQCVSTDDLSDKDTVNAGLSVDTVNYDATVTAPAAARCWIFESIVNNGISNGVSDSTLTTRFKIRVLTVDGLEVVAVDETTEGSSSFGWSKALNEKIRQAASIGVTPGGADGDMQYNNAGALGGTSALSVDGSDIVVAGTIKSAATHAKEATVTTTNATTTTLTSFDISAASGLYVVDAIVGAVKSDGTVAKWWKVSRAYNNDAGVYSDGTQRDVDSEDVAGAPAWTVAIDRSAGTVRVRVTGAAATTVKWTVLYQHVLCVPT